MQKARRSQSSCVRPLVDTRFQGLFHSLIQGSFHLSLTVLVHYRSLRSIQPYQMVLVDSDRISHVPPYSGYYQVMHFFHIRDYHPLWQRFHRCSIKNTQSTLQSYNPNIAETTLVQAVPRSLATTRRITFVFFSSDYLDVSVHRVGFYKQILCLQHSGLPHSETCGLEIICIYPQLIAACRVLHRL